MPNCGTTSQPDRFPMKTFFSLAFSLLIISFGTGCDRAFQDVGEATIEVVGPNPTVALVENTIDLELRVSSVREVTQVHSNRGSFAKDAGSGLWKAPISLSMGLNQIIIEAFVDDGPTRVDTVSFFRLTFTHESVPNSPLPFTTGSHSISLIANDDLLLVGGNAGAGDTASLDAHVLHPGANLFQPLKAFSIFPRVGHSTTVLPNGKVLIMGGAVLGDISVTTDLVSPVELFDPSDQSFSPVPFKGDPIRRMYHTSIIRLVNGQPQIDLLGGRGDVQYTPAPLLGIRQDLRSFVFRNDSLIALSPAVGPFIEPIAGHIQTALDGTSLSTGTRFLVNGLRFDTEMKPTSFIMDYASPFGIEITPTAPMNEPRIRHAAVQVAPGVVALFGGRAEDPTVVFGTGELFIEAANAYFTLPFAITPRFGLTATRLNNGRIVLFGGFDATSNATDATDFVSLQVE